MHKLIIFRICGTYFLQLDLLFLAIYVVRIIFKPNKTSLKKPLKIISIVYIIFDTIFSIILIIPSYDMEMMSKFQFIVS